MFLTGCGENLVEMAIGLGIPRMLWFDHTDTGYYRHR